MFQINFLRACFFINVAIFCSAHVSPDAQAQVGRDTPLWVWSGDASHHDSIVQIESDGGYGTGVIVSVNREKPVADGFEGLCLTAWHVVKDDQGERKIKVKYHNGRVAKQCDVIAFDEKLDVALLWVWVPETIRETAVAAVNAVSGDALELAGLGGGSAVECCLRHFASNASSATNEKQIFADVPLLPGDSGGPVFNKNGEVVGIISGGWFWWDGGVKTKSGRPINVTWPARASNLNPIQNLLSDAEAGSTHVATNTSLK